MKRMAGSSILLVSRGDERMWDDNEGSNHPEKIRLTRKLIAVMVSKEVPTGSMANRSLRSWTKLKSSVMVLATVLTVLSRVLRAHAPAYLPDKRLVRLRRRLSPVPAERDPLSCGDVPSLLLPSRLQAVLCPRCDVLCSANVCALKRSRFRAYSVIVAAAIAVAISSVLEAVSSLSDSSASITCFRTGIGFPLVLAYSNTNS